MTSPNITKEQAQQPPWKLMQSLFKELFQTEHSATKHPSLEAERLGRQTPPGQALLAVAAHGERVLASLPALAQARGFATSVGGLSAGSMFSAGRDRLADLALNAEQSYRGTLLGVRHGVDLVRLLRSLSVVVQDQELVAWCDGWLAERTALVTHLQEQLAWFALNPERALQPAKRSVMGGAARAVMLVVDKIEDAFSRTVSPST